MVWNFTSAPILSKHTGTKPRALRDEATASRKTIQNQQKQQDPAPGSLPARGLVINCGVVTKLPNPQDPAPSSFLYTELSQFFSESLTKRGTVKPICFGFSLPTCGS